MACEADAASALLRPTALKSRFVWVRAHAATGDGPIASHGPAAPGRGPDGAGVVTMSITKVCRLMIRFGAYLKRVPNQQQQPLASSLLAPVELTRITSVLVASLLVQLCPQVPTCAGWWAACRGGACAPSPGPRRSPSSPSPRLFFRRSARRTASVPGRGASAKPAHTMDALQAEIARKRKEREANAGTAAAGPRKWIKKGDLEKQREAAYLQTEATEQEERQKKLVVPQHRDAAIAAEQAAERKRLAGESDALQDEQQQGAGASSATAGSSGSVGGGVSRSGAGASTDSEAALRPVDVMRRLRALGQPIRLFGETDEERYDRYRAVSSALPSEAEVDLELKKGQMFDQRQLFERCGVKSLLRSVLDGFSGTVFAYGQTGSGKTYTMTGVVDEGVDE